MATLAGFPVKDNESIKKTTPRGKREREASQAAEKIEMITVEPFDLFRQSRFKWYQNEAGRWVLETSAGYIVIMQNRSGRWSVGSGSTWYSKYPGFKTLTEAFALGEQIAAQKMTA